MTSDFPFTPEQIETGWLTETLHRTGGLPLDSSVTSIAVERIGGGFGQTSEMARLRLETTGPDPHPLSIVCKTPTTDEHRLAVARRVGFYFTEIKFYDQIASQISTRTPKCYAAEIDVDGNFLLLMEDFPHHRPGDEVVGLSLADAQLAVPQAARLHAPFWNNPAIHDMAPFPPQIPGDALAEPWKIMMDTFGEHMPPEVGELYETYRDSAPALHEWATTGVTTLVHGDFRVDNMMYGTAATPDADKLVVLDWQGLSVRRGITDIAYLISHSMPVDLRREHELPLLRIYLAELAANGVKYDEEEALHDYKVAMLYLLWVVVWITGIHVNSHERALRRKRGLVNRAFTAINDHHALDLLPFSGGEARVTVPSQAVSGAE